MPRDGSNVYIQPFPNVVTDTTIESPVYNGFTNDVAQDLNTPRPIVAGGTAANNINDALFNLSAGKAAQVVTNYDSHLWVPGSFYSASSATAPPVAAHAFSGIAYIGEALANPPTNANVTVEARDTTDGKLYIRRKVAGVWGAWTLYDDPSGVSAAVALKVDKAGDTMTGMLVLPVTTPTLGTHATNKTYVDAADTALAGVNTTQDTAINNRVRYDAAQGLTALQQDQARENVSSFGVVRTQLFTSNGTYTPHANMVYCVIECLGGGGGSGGLLNSGAGTGQASGAGGAGSYSRRTVSKATIGASQTVTIGAAGAAGSAAGPTSGGNGGDSSVGILCVGKGGGGGGAGLNGIGGAGGVAGTGDLVGAGQPGSAGMNQTIITIVTKGGRGGSTMWGGGGGEVIAAGVAVPGSVGTGYGSGAGAPATQNAAGPANGTPGQAGIAVITEYCSK